MPLVSRDSSRAGAPLLSFYAAKMQDDVGLYLLYLRRESINIAAIYFIMH